MVQMVDACTKLGQSSIASTTKKLGVLALTCNPVETGDQKLHREIEASMGYM